ncbi:MAG TPA: hypothetical protein VNN09_10850 [Candidatus Competibacteraceae bacterium]|nr:hypothetical protein [Candidatus Competibacteraceae bacterium]
MYQLLAPSYLLPTPAGAYQAVCTPAPGPLRRLLLALMTESRSQCGAPLRLRAWSGLDDEQAALELLYRLQELGLVQGEAQSRTAPQGPLPEILPPLLRLLSSAGRALLADSQGLYVATAGFAHETAEELAALGADLASLYGRHQGLLARNLGLRQRAWALSDAAGNSQIGFWPLAIGETEFTLVIAEAPQLNQPAFRDLVWTLGCRYGQGRPSL